MEQYYKPEVLKKILEKAIAKETVIFENHEREYRPKEKLLEKEFNRLKDIFNTEYEKYNIYPYTIHKVKRHKDWISKLFHLRDDYETVFTDIPLEKFIDSLKNLLVVEEDILEVDVTRFGDLFFNFSSELVSLGYHPGKWELNFRHGAGFHLKFKEYTKYPNRATLNRLEYLLKDLNMQAETVKLSDEDQQLLRGLI